MKSHGGEGVCPGKGLLPGQLVSCPGRRPVWGMEGCAWLWGVGCGQRIFLGSSSGPYSAQSSCYGISRSTSLGVGAVPCHRAITVGAGRECAEERTSAWVLAAVSLNHCATWPFVICAACPAPHQGGSTPTLGPVGYRETLDPSLEVRRWAQRPGGTPLVGGCFEEAT